MNKHDFIIIGAGIVGLSIANELQRHGVKSIGILEKEETVGLHSSGRNSGVLHAGIYYSTDSFKAKFCSEGAKRLYQFAAEKNISVKKTGKVIVATTPDEVPQLEVLFNRSMANNIQVEWIDEKQLHEIEPEAFTVEKALFSPNTGVIDSKGVLASLESDVINRGGSLYKIQEALTVDLKQKLIKTQSEQYSYGHAINCAGLHADKIAHAFEVGRQYHILPFKGLYHKLKPEAAKRFRGSIYPVPDLRVPFLGVHVTRTVHDDVILGPTAIPALGRENYQGLKGINWLEWGRIFSDLSLMYLRNKEGFRTLVHSEIPKYSQTRFLSAVKKLAPRIMPSDLASTGKVGLRAQLVDERNMKLVMDFLIEDGPDSTHILNAISPAFTASFAFAEFLVQKLKQKKVL